MHGARGFTLIELSIVLVIIGLLVGGILVARDLIKAAEVRAQITQIEKYNQAVNTFRGKYGALPGDMPAATANQFGFAARGQYAGEGDGNGVIEGVAANAPGTNQGNSESAGETVMFWVDLSSPVAGKLIEGQFSTASSSIVPASIPNASLGQYFPQAKIGQGTYVIADSGNGQNFYTISTVSSVAIFGILVSSAQALVVLECYNIDKKIDDGLPQSGNVMAMYNYDSNWVWADMAGGGPSVLPIPETAATPASTTSCYDNGNAAGAPMQYSISSLANYGTGSNCALSFKFQ